jgi:hypothetical protein
MATINFFINAEERELAYIYIRFSAGRKVDLIIKSGLIVERSRWSNDTQSIKQRIKTDDNEKLIFKLKGLKEHIEREYKDFFGDPSKEWLLAVIYRY